MQLRADEAAVVEKAVRLAIESVMNVLCAVNSSRTNELQRLVSDREQEVRRLEERVREAEGEVRLLRRCWSRVPEQRSAEQAERSAEEVEQQRECEVRVSLSLMTGPPSQDPPDGLDLDHPGSSKDQSVSAPVPQTCPAERHVQQQPSQSVPPAHEPNCPSESHLPQDPDCPADGAVPSESHCPMNKPLKQEPLFPSPVQIKQEPFCPDYAHVPQEDVPAMFLQRDLSDEVSHRVQDILGHCELWQSVSPESEGVPVPVSVPHALPGPSRNRKLAVSRRDQSEEAMRRRRASWRAASRRYYARKMARLQTHASSSSGLGPCCLPLSTPPARALTHR
ncbi:hypothetical protein WMY93_026201 [Mugilogobius chulae]|uniref:Uncharacterized protein n=1 Tax=Mugilogobius chulae TaxID=88201 RepID=A0AAW0N8N1_9GOBI